MKLILNKKLKREKSIISASFWLTIFFFVFFAANISMLILFFEKANESGNFFIKNPIAIIFIILLALNIIAILAIATLKYQMAKKENNSQLRKYYLLTLALILLFVWFIPFISGTMASKEINSDRINEHFILQQKQNS
ncbi:hypothetical protein DA803_01860 [[Mycoplasma] phocae]|uniref:Uncharacterized protein n=1 Tax=[Mycoplasma] phocae TaxID=142651 RepID=A0A2Z5IQA1_9BACT|nr:hypothetical protein [[Mycoplasma] phocae]AXE60830.1 hypothetical protein DA803_01860 [[Mycoplasma] phocae]